MLSLVEVVVEPDQTRIVFVDMDGSGPPATEFGRFCQFPESLYVNGQKLSAHPVTYQERDELEEYTCVFS